MFTGENPEKLRSYLECIAGIDENVGKIMAELEKLALAENTVVVFAGDNGFYLREHGLLDKRSAYEESLRIPMLLRYPKLAAKGKTINAMVLNIDLAPTLLDMAGVAVPKQMQGRSWLPLLEGKEVPWRSSFYYEYFFEPPFASPHVQALRTNHAKLVQYPGHPEWAEMFDLAADPYEVKNLINDPTQAEQRSKLEAEFERAREKVQRAGSSTSQPAVSAS